MEGAEPEPEVAPAETPAEDPSVADVVGAANAVNDEATEQAADAARVLPPQPAHALLLVLAQVLRYVGIHLGVRRVDRALDVTRPRAECDRLVRAARLRRRRRTARRRSTPRARSSRIARPRRAPTMWGRPRPRAWRARWLASGAGDC